MKHKLYKVTSYYKKKFLLYCVFYDIKSVITYIHSCLKTDAIDKDKNFRYIIEIIEI